MAEIKRPNYFTFQFLVEKDFDDEQAYHLGMRRRHNRLAHTFGVAGGFAITKNAPRQVRIAAGTAIDSTGREIAFEDAQNYTLMTTGAGTVVYLSVAYQETFDPADHYTQGGVDDFTRTTERPLFQDSNVPPPTDGSVILLATITLNASGNIESDGSIDMSQRTSMSAKLAPSSVTAVQLADSAVTLYKLSPELRPKVNILTGVVTFTNLAGVEQFSNDIDPGFGPGAVAVQLAVDDLTANISSSGDPSTARPVQLRSEVNRATGTFRVFAMRTSGSGQTKVRWFAFRTQPGADSSVTVTVSVNPNSPTLAGNVTQLLTATVSNTNNTAVTWANPPESGGGTISGSTATTTTYTSPGVTGIYHVTATSVADTSRFATATLNVNAAVTVLLTQTTANLFTNGTLSLTADVINTTTKTVTWSLSPTTGSGSLSSTTASTITYTPPNAPGQYTVIATSTIDNTKKAQCVVNVSAVTISAAPAASQIIANGSTTVTATIGPAGASPNANWSVTGGASVSPATGPSTMFTPPSSGGTFTITAASVTDTSKTATCVVTATPVAVSISPTSTTVTTNQQAGFSVGVTPSFANQTVSWSANGGQITVNPFDNHNANFSASSAGTYTLTATSVANSSKAASATITVNAPSSPGPGGPGPGPGGKVGPRQGLQVISENIVSESSLSHEKAAPKSKTASSEKTSTHKKGHGKRTFIRPHKRPKSKVPRRGDD